MSQLLQAIDFPLWGSRLIEASAGTGKTWTIAALYLRLVLGHGGSGQGQGLDEQADVGADADVHSQGNGFERPLRPADILVMTFTRAATRELSDRIRARLIEAAKCFRGQADVPAHDTLLRDLLAAYPEGPARDSAGWRLATAAEGMDDAAVHTIDAWCQRMLREHAFDSGNLFSEELMADEQALLTEAAQDYWRQQCYPLSAELLDEALKVWKDVDALVKDMASLVDQDRPASDVAGSLGDCLNAVLGRRRDALTQLKSGWTERAVAMHQWLQGRVDQGSFPWNKGKLAPAKFASWFDELSSWAKDPVQIQFGKGKDGKDKTWKKHLTPDGLAAALNAKAMMPDLPEHFAAFADLLDGLAACMRPITWPSAWPTSSDRRAPLALPTCSTAWSRRSVARMASACANA
jgi:exodeoxyribonuclease V beta subunit